MINHGLVDEISVDEAMARLVVQSEYDDGEGARPCVHNFLVAGGFALLGAHMGLAEARDLMERYGVAEAGDAAAAMGHTLVTIEPAPNGPRFWEANERGMTPPDQLTPGTASERVSRYRR